MKKYSLVAQIAEVERELEIRKRVYSGLVGARKMKEDEATIKMDTMRSVLETLRWIKENEQIVRDAIAFEKGKVENG